MTANINLSVYVSSLFWYYLGTGVICCAPRYKYCGLRCLTTLRLTTQSLVDIPCKVYVLTKIRFSDLRTCDKALLNFWDLTGLRCLTFTYYPPYAVYTNYTFLTMYMKITGYKLYTSDLIKILNLHFSFIIPN